MTDLDRRLAGLVVQHGVVTAEAAKKLEERAEAEKRAFSVLVVDAAGEQRFIVLSLLRALHAGFPATDEDALDRHEDRLAARLAVKVGILDEATGRAAFAEQDALRVKGERKRLGEILLARGKLDAVRAERLYRQLENAVVICHDCFSANPRGSLAPGAELECPRCGTKAPVPPLAEKPAAAGTAAPPAPAPVAAPARPPSARMAPLPPPMQGATPSSPAAPAPPPPASPAPEKTPSGSAPAAKSTPSGRRPAASSTPSGRALNAKASSGRMRALTKPGTESGELLASAQALTSENPLDPEGEKAAETVPKRLVPQKRRRPRLGPEEGAAPKDRRPLIVGMVVLVFVLAAVVIILASSERAAARLEAWKEHAAQAAKKKAAGDLAGAAGLYAQADVDLQGRVPESIKTEVEAARADRAACEALAASLSKLESDATALDAFLEQTKDRDLLLAACEALGASGSAATLPPLARLAASQDTQVRERAVAIGLRRGGEAALPALAARLASTDDATAQDAAARIVAVKDKAALPLIEKALARFPRDTALSAAVVEAVANNPGPETLPVLRKLAHDSSARVAERAIRLLADRKADAAAELVLGLDGAPDLREACAAVLVAQGDKAVPALAAAFKGGQATAAQPLIGIGDAAAQEALRAGLAALDWENKGIVLLFASEGGDPPRWLRASVSGILDDARKGLAAHDPGLTRTVLSRIVSAARAFSLPDSADDLFFELQFLEMRDRNAKPLGDQSSLVEGESKGEAGTARLELRNNTDLRLVVYARGPRKVTLRALPGTDNGDDVPPGKYLVGLTCIDAPQLCELSEVTVEAGKLLAVEVGGSRTVDVPLTQPPVTPPVTPRPTAGAPASTEPEETEGQRMKQVFERAFELEKMTAEAKKLLEERLKERPWPASSETVKKSAHYQIYTDAGATTASAVADALEKAHAAFSKILPAPANTSFPVRFFKKQEDFEGWMRKTSLMGIICDRAVKKWDLVSRTRKLEPRILATEPKAAAAKVAAIVELIAKALETGRGMDAIDRQSLADYDNEVGRAEAATDQNMFKRAVMRSLSAIHAPDLLGVVADNAPHSIVLGYFNPLTKELCLFERPAWAETIKHEAFHQFLFEHAPHTPRWLNEGLATYFECEKGTQTLQYRIDELKEGQQEIRLIDQLSVSALVTTEQLESLDYAISWSFVTYLVQEEPQVLAMMLSRSQSGQGSALAMLSAFDDLKKTEKKWREKTRQLVLGK